MLYNRASDVPASFIQSLLNTISIITNNSIIILLFCSRSPMLLPHTLKLELQITYYNLNTVSQ